MATIKTTTYILSCPRCRTQLISLSGRTIGSPLLTCYHCGNVAKTDLRSEWYNYPGKMQVCLLPWALPVISLIVGSFSGNIALGALCASITLIFSLILSIRYAIQIVASINRMRDAAYLNRLLRYGAITAEDHEYFMRKAKRH